MASYVDDNPFAAAGSAFRKQRAYEEASVRTAVNEQYKKPVVTRYEEPSPVIRPPPTIQPKKEQNAFAAAADAPEPAPNPASAPATVPPPAPSAWLNEVPTSAGPSTGLKGMVEKGETRKPDWVSDEDCPTCTGCRCRFDMHKRRHHCRGCGQIFCHACTPSPKMMLPAEWGVKEPQRCCVECAEVLRPMQSELIKTNSNALRDNHYKSSGIRRYVNNPLSFTLGSNIRKATYSLDNLMDGVETIVDDTSISAELLKGAKGFFFLTVAKIAFGAGVRVGTGLVILRLPSKKGEVAGQRWSAPCAVGFFGCSVGVEAGLETVDTIVPINDLGILEALASGKKRLCVGQEAAMSIGPLGRNYSSHDLPTTTGVAQTKVNKHRNQGPASAHTGGKRVGSTSYSHSRGLYGGVSIQGAVMSVRKDVNLDYYGTEFPILDILGGKVSPPPNAKLLYEKIQQFEIWSGSMLASNQDGATTVVSSGEGGGGGGEHEPRAEGGEAFL